MAASVLEGANGYLFLDNDSNQLIRQITGEMKVSDEWFSQINGAHVERALVCERIGAAYRHVICPNKESALWQFLPPEIRYQQSGPSFVEQYLTRRPQIAPFYDRTFADGIEGMYFKTDSHWTHAGALVYLKRCLAHFGDDLSHALVSNMELQLTQRERIGDLGGKIGRPAESVPWGKPAHSKANIVFEGNIVNEGYVRMCRNADGRRLSGRALVLHDSFTHYLFPYIQEFYNDTLFIHCPDADLHFIELFSPDVVWFFQVERFLPRRIHNQLELITFLRAKEAEKGVHAHASNLVENLTRMEGPDRRT